MTRNIAAEQTLSYDRTWHRRKAHRNAVAEVFVTDAIIYGENRVCVAAQTPPCHSFYGDHLPKPLQADSLLLMEICRQAGLVTAYELGIPVDTILATSEWDLRVDSEYHVPYGTPADLLLDSRFEWIRVRNGRPRVGRCHQAIFYENRQVAALTAISTLFSPDELADVRRMQRGNNPRWSHEMSERDLKGVAEPARVGRHDLSNVVVVDLHRNGVKASAQVAPSLKNRALFDHSYDHVTMQVLSEAARQISIALLGCSENWTLARLQGNFERFTELDAPVSMTASISSKSSTVLSVVNARQHDRITSSFELTFERRSSFDFGARAYNGVD